MFRKVGTALLLSTLAASAFAQQTKPVAPAKQVGVASAAKTADYTQEAYVVEKYATVYRFENDGRGFRRETARFRVQSEAALQALGQLVFAYSSATENLKINYVRVLKSDGTVVTAGESAVQDMTSPVAREAPIYSDLRQKHVTVPSLRPGEVLEYEIEVEQKEPLAPGQFWMEHTFQKDTITLDETLELNIPAARQIQLRTEPGFEPKIAEENGRKVYRWTSNHLEREQKSKKKDSAPKKKSDRSDVAVTTFADWDQLAAWYRGLEKDRRVPSLEIAAKAKQLTDGARTDREKVEAIYDYVSQGFRYVSLSFGVGRFQPHAAADVFSNQYGDCKDKNTLLGAMLDAVGIKSETILIHSQRKLDRTIATPSQFDHVITAVELDGKRTIVDTTTEIAPYAVLFPMIRNKDAVLIAPTGKAEIVHTPADLPFPGTQNVEIEGKVTEFGRVERRVKYTARGDLEDAFRVIFRRVPEAKWAEVLESVANYDGMPGEVKDVRVSNVTDTHKPIVVEFTLTSPNFIDFSSKKSKISVPLPAMRLPAPDEDDSEPYQMGASGEVRLSVHLTLPEKFKVSAPLPIVMKRDYAEFQSSYEARPGSISAVRKLKTLTTEVPIARASDIRAFRNVVNRDADQVFSVELDEVGAESVPKDADPKELEEAANSAFEAKNFKLAVELWKKVVEDDPKHKTAWNNLGRAYMNLVQYDKAIEALKKQVEVNPYDEYAYNNLGLVYQRMQRFDEAEAAFRKQIEINPLDRYAHGNLAQIMMQRHRYAEAIPELEQTLAIVGDGASSSYVQQQLGDAYLKTGKVDKAMENFDKVLKTSPNPMMWNNVAYSLAEEKQALDRAEKYAQSAVSMTVASLNNLPVDQLMETGGYLTNSLASYWDTLGWVYFQQDKLDDAEKYIRASWQVSESGEVGDHLAQILEKRGQKQQAIDMYAKSMASSRSVPETRKRLAGLVGESKVDSTVNSVRQKLGTDRTLALGKAQHDGSAEFNVVLRGTSPEKVQYVKGSETLKSFTEQLTSLKYPGDAPGQDVRIVRRGILSCSKLTSRCDFVLLPSGAATAESMSDVPPELQEVLRRVSDMGDSIKQ